MSKAQKAKKNSHVPAKYIEDIAGLASSVEVDKNPKYVQSATDGIQPLSQEEFDRPKPTHPATSKKIPEPKSAQRGRKHLIGVGA